MLVKWVGVVNTFLCVCVCVCMCMCVRVRVCACVCVLYDVLAIVYCADGNVLFDMIVYIIKVKCMYVMLEDMWDKVLH